ncbi:hypothetical protein US8_00963 [Bacillus altitudinis]|nr:hypothetical protein US8_00963 [Bacillus altitudinis]
MNVCLQIRGIIWDVYYNTVDQVVMFIILFKVVKFIDLL